MSSVLLRPLLLLVPLASCTASPPPPSTSVTTATAPASATALASVPTTSSALAPTASTVTAVAITPSASTSALAMTPSASAPASATPSASAPARAILAACPATYAQAIAGSCAPESNGKLRCKYPQGQCECRTMQQCSGVAPRLPIEPTPVGWSCLPRTREDGCPGIEPNDGATCALPGGRECSYLSGGCQMTVKVCSNRSWRARLVSGPPPGAPPGPPEPAR